MENELETPEETSDNETAAPQPAEKAAWRLPLILTTVSLLVWFGFQTVGLVVERGNLITLRGNLEAPMQESQKVRAQLETLITKTTELANQGNATAKFAIEQLEKRGIPIKGAVQPAK